MQRVIQETVQKPIVVKLGGSLLGRLPYLVPVLKRSPRPLLIVPGGGVFADAVRMAHVKDDVAAHWMAIAAMDQYGWILSENGISVTDSLDVPDRTTVLLPYIPLREKDPLPHAWDITSDSIAAWVAGMLHLDLLVLKSVDGIIVDNRLKEFVTQPIKTETVDPFFIPYVLKQKIPTTIINGSNPDRVEKFLGGLPVPGTIIGTTF